MKAIIQDRFDSPDELHLEDVAMPAADRNEVLVRVRATSANTYGWDVPGTVRRLARLFGLPRKPRTVVPGLDLAGTVDAVGTEVEEFRPGDEVFGWCKGSFAEFASVPQDQLAVKPGRLTMAEAATVPTAGTTALQALRKGHIRPEQKVLVVGASGGVGTFAVQIAKSFGATVTGVCSTPNRDLVAAIGADYVIDYTQADFTRCDRSFDVIIDMVGNRSLDDLRRPLGPSGTLVMVGQAGIAAADQSYLRAFGRWGQAIMLSTVSAQTMTALVRTTRQSDLVLLGELIESGSLTPVISAEYPLSEATAAVHHFEAGHARGRVAITM